MVSTNLRVEVFSAIGVTRITTSGTSKDDRYKIENLDGLVDEINLNTGSGIDMVDIVVGGKNTAKDTAITVTTADGDDVIWVTGGGSEDTINAIFIDSGSGDDRFKVGSSIAAPVVMNGGLGNDTLTMDGNGSSYEFLAAFGAAGSDVIMGGEGIDIVYGDDTLDWSQRAAFATALAARLAANNVNGDGLAGVQAQADLLGGMDTIMTYGGKDYVDGGDETVALIGSGDSAVLSVYYKPDGTPLDAQYYNADGTLTAAGFNQDYTIQNQHGDLISTGDEIDLVYGGAGYDTINGGSGANTVYSGAGDDIIDARESSGSVEAGDGDDTIDWLYAAGTTLTVDGGAGNDLLSAILVDQEGAAGINDQVVSISDVGSVAVLQVNSDTISLPQVESLVLSMKDGGDTLTINDVIGTDLRSIDVDAGSSPETMWLADRDDRNNQAVSPANNALQYLPVILAGATGITLSYKGELEVFEATVATYDAAGLATALATLLATSGDSVEAIAASAAKLRTIWFRPSIMVNCVGSLI